MASNPNLPIHPSFHERISVLVEGQLPDFVKQDHATFVAFLEAYYEYLEQTGNPYEIIGNLRNYFNIDKTVDDFLQYFKTQFGKDVPEAVFANANKPSVLKHLRDFYRAKGSEKSFQFLFRLLYKEEIEFYYPSIDMLRISDGRYTKDKIVRCIDTSGSSAVFDFTGKTITGGSSGATGIVELVLKEMIGVFEVSTIYLSKVAGIFVAGETVTEGTNTFTLDGMVTGYTVTNSGNGYSVDDNIPVVGGGAGAAGAQFLIDTLTTGSITLYNIVSGGTGYVVGDKLTINNTNKLEIDGRTCSVLVKTVDGSGVIQTVEFEHNGYGYKAIPTISGGGTGTGANITLSGVGIGGIKTLKLINGGFHYQIVPTLNCTTNGDGTATAIATIGGYENEANIRWVGDDGFISAANYIQDSRYYQAFSYEIKAGNTIDKWRDYVKRLVHPSGFALFGRTLITGLLQTGLRMQPGEKEFRVPYVHTYPYKIIFHDGDIEPPVRLNLQLQQTNDEWPSGGAWPHSGYQNGNGGHSDWHIYEIDIPIIVLSIAESNDWLFVQQPTSTDPPLNPENWNDPSGTLVSAITASEDWGQVSSGIGGALQLGPLRRQLDRQKFNKEGGFSKSSTRQIGSGYTSIPTIVFSSPPSGTTATGTAIVSSETVTGITMTDNGSGYLIPPTITISGGGGSGASAKAITTGYPAETANQFYPGSSARNANPQSVSGVYMVETTHSSFDNSGATPSYTPDDKTVFHANCSHSNAPFTSTIEDLGGGYTIDFFKSEQISRYITTQNEKTRIVMNSHISIV